ncbi:baseplate J/gp47 family protein [Anaerocolumna sp. MB42-C2]|uniref:baseplate J/gp47 family protein n=1 Tax=Anaerocolumna sp. MB42-C2 TaxID=3070997 RepID=UPI0027DFAD09|nr:baseplate J/gp47 family protein [Anaerocolumna sp. MB42-C2]WMJ90622.1 baseplate J/gp47 family protein [Anaerocolumna sp. MB42-C2]
MFEEMTYETILDDMLSRVTNDVDKREGSVIYDALAPCAYQLAQNYFNLNNFIDLVSGDTAVGIYLDRIVADYGITRKPAIKAIRKIITNGEVPVGSRWGLGETTYSITDDLSGNSYVAQCEQTGEVGNQYTGPLQSLDNISGVTASLDGILKTGEEEETDENLRARFYTQIQSPSTSGNADNYKKWALEVPGVGDAKVYPLWNGNGTVKVIIVDSNMAIDPGLEQPVYKYIETVRPIGATVTVTSPVSKEITVSANIKPDGTRHFNEVINSFTKSFTEYLKGTIFEAYVVSYAKIGSILLTTEGVSDYSDLLVNNGVTNISIEETETPIAGNVVLTEV